MPVDRSSAWIWNYCRLYDQWVCVILNPIYFYFPSYAEVDVGRTWLKWQPQTLPFRQMPWLRICWSWGNASAKMSYGIVVLKKARKFNYETMKVTHRKRHLPYHDPYYRQEYQKLWVVVNKTRYLLRISSQIPNTKVYSIEKCSYPSNFHWIFTRDRIFYCLILRDCSTYCSNRTLELISWGHADEVVENYRPWTPRLPRAFADCQSKLVWSD